MSKGKVGIECGKPENYDTVKSNYAEAEMESTSKIETSN